MVYRGEDLMSVSLELLIPFTQAENMKQFIFLLSNNLDRETTYLEYNIADVTIPQKKSQ